MTQPSSAAIAAARLGMTHWKIPASVQLAQWAVESAWGTKSAGPHNWFGMKALAGQPSVMVSTHEVYRGVRIAVTLPFRAFASDAEAFDAHAKLLATGAPYVHARTLLPDPFKFAAALTGVYATDPHYGDTLAALMRTSNLVQYDRMAA